MYVQSFIWETHALLLATSLCVVVLAAGFGALRLLGLTKGLLGLGFAPAAGLALLGVVTTWTTLLGAPPVLGTVLVLAAALCGLYLAFRELAAVRDALSVAGEHRPALVVLCVSVIVPALILGMAFGDLQVPFSTHDGAYHVETIEAMRAGQGWHGWYPPGYHATVAAFLGLMPWVDSALGTFQASLGLTLLAQVGVFGFGCAIWRKPLVAAVGALLVTLTYQYPYTIHFWALWPMLEGLILVLALWAAALYYLELPRTRWALLCGLFAAAIGLTHTIEVYTAIIGIACILAAHWGRVQWLQLARHVSLALAIALVLVVPYVPPVLGWAHAGGAVANGAATGSSIEGRLGLTGGLPILLLDLTGGFLLDAPVRLLLVCLGVWWALRQPNGRLLVAMAGAFLAIPLTLVYADIAPVQWVFAATYPWSHGYRLLMVAALLLAMLCGAGVVSVAQHLPRLRAAGGRQPRLGRVLARALAGVGLLVALAGVVLVPQRLAVEGTHDAVYLPDDAAAMTWLAQHAVAGELLANDGASDAGIWAPYKAGVTLLLPRLDHGDRLDVRLALSSELDKLDVKGEARTTACMLGLRYVYAGASNSGFWEPHQFPPRGRLRTEASLEEVFSSGGASVFRTRLDCSD